MIQPDIPKKTIGRVEVVSFPEQDDMTLHARIDTGARNCAIWGHAQLNTQNQLLVTFLGNKHGAYTGRQYVFDTFSQIVVASSTGHEDERYAVKLLVRIGGKKIRATFTIANRSSQVYPVLIGRNVLRGKFIVDVKHGPALAQEEERRIAALQAQLGKKESRK
jgi:hypothetical protein